MEPELKIISWSPQIQHLSPPKILVLDDCLLSFSDCSFTFSPSPENSSNSMIIANLEKQFWPKNDLKFHFAPKPSYLTINNKGELIIDDFDVSQPIYLNFHYLFCLDSKKVNPINEVCFCYDETLLFFQGEYIFESENSKSSFFFEIPQDFCPETDVVSFQTRKSKENHNRLVVHSSGLIQFKPQLSTFLSGCFFSKTAKFEKIEVEFTEKNIKSSNFKGYLVKGNLVIIEGLIEFEQEKENRIFASLKEERVRPKREMKFVNCIKEKWDFTVVSIGSDGKIGSSKGKSVWLNLVYFI